MLHGALSHPGPGTHPRCALSPPHTLLQDGRTPLHLAALQGHTVVVTLLLDRHAAIEAKANVSSSRRAREWPSSWVSCLRRAHTLLLTSVVSCSGCGGGAALGGGCSTRVVIWPARIVVVAGDPHMWVLS